MKRQAKTRVDVVEAGGGIDGIRRHVVVCIAIGVVRIEEGEQVMLELVRIEGN